MPIDITASARRLCGAVDYLDNIPFIRTNSVAIWHASVRAVPLEPRYSVHTPLSGPSGPDRLFGAVLIGRSGRDRSTASTTAAAGKGEPSSRRRIMLASTSPSPDGSPINASEPAIGGRSILNRRSKLVQWRRRQRIKSRSTIGPPAVSERRKAGCVPTFDPRLDHGQQLRAGA
jgi:hypothetical protein